MKYKQLWIRFKDYKKIRSVFPAMRGETIVHYFERIAQYLEDYDTDLTKKQEDFMLLRDGE